MCQEIPLTLIWCIVVYFPDTDETRWGFINDVVHVEKSILINQSTNNS